MNDDDEFEFQRELLEETALARHLSYPEIIFSLRTILAKLAENSPDLKIRLNNEEIKVFDFLREVNIKDGELENYQEIMFET